MNIETERRYLIDPVDLCVNILDLEQHTIIQQGYFTCKEVTNRVRVMTNKLGDQDGYITYKDRINELQSKEFEYQIPYSDAIRLLELCEHKLEKIRTHYEYRGRTWEIDIFLGRNKGLIIAEIEFDPKSSTVIETPPFVTVEITRNKSYSNHSLSIHPYSKLSLDEE